MAAPVYQLPAAPSSFVDDNAIVVNHLRSTSPEAVKAAKDYAAKTNQPDVGRLVESLLEIGGKAVALGSSTLDVDEIKRSLDKFTADVAATAQTSVADLRAAVDKATDKDEGTIALTVTQAMEKLAREMGAALDGEDAPVRVAIGKTVKDLTDKALLEVQHALAAHQQAVHTLLSTDSSDSPLNVLKRDLLDNERQTREDIKTQLNKIETLVDVAHEHNTMLTKTTAKGIVYEDDVVAALVEIGLGAGDSVEPTGTVIGSIPRCKKGDAVITVSETASHGHPILIAVEAKDQPFNSGQWHKELDSVRKNRSAVAAIGVARHTEQMPGHHRVLIFDPLHVVVAFDPVEDDPWILYAVYHLVRAQAAALVLDGTGQDFDVSAVQDKLAKALDQLDEFDKVERAVRGARGQLDIIESSSGKLRKELSDMLKDTNTILSAGLSK